MQRFVEIWPGQTDSGHFCGLYHSRDGDRNISKSVQETADTEETEPETETVQVAKQLILHIGSQNEDGDYYAALDGSKEVHVVSGDTIKELIEKESSGFYG